MKLDSKIDLLRSYIPAPILRKVAARPLSPSAPECEREGGAVLYADISGFTPLAEKLGSQGPRGVEELSRCLETYFGRLIAILSRRGGEVLKFAGDAVLVWWPAEEGDFERAVLQAAACGVEVAEALHGSEVSEGIPLSLRVGVSAGEVASLYVGGVNGKWEYLLAGDPVVDACHAQGQAPLGGVAAAAAAWPWLSSAWNGVPLDNGGMVLRGKPPVSVPPPAPSVRLDASAEQSLQAFIPETVQDRIDARQGSWIGELRKVTPVFIKLNGLDYDRAETAAHLQRATVTVQEQAARFEGTLVQTVVDDKGTVLIIVFGLPPRVHEDDAARAVQAALEIRKELHRHGIACAIGASSGRAYCGNRGSAQRREYGLIGDTMNLAARLMQHAGDGIRCDKATMRLASEQGGLTFASRGSVQFKGKSALLTVFEPVEGVRADRADLQRSKLRAPMVGRQQERKILRDRLELFSRSKNDGAIVLEGEAGIGKSRLIEYVEQTAAELGLAMVSGAGDTIQKGASYYAWQRIFAATFGLSDTLSTQEVEAKVTATLSGIDEQLSSLAPLASVVLPEAIADNPFTQMLAGDVRAERTRDLLRQVLARRAEEEKLVVVLEDAHWLDSSSWALAELVAREVPSILLILASRPPTAAAGPEAAALLDMASTQTLRLGSMAEYETFELLKHRLGVNSLPPEVLDFIRQKAEGNPFFSEELIYALREAALIRIENGACLLAVPPDRLRALDFPDTVEGVVTSRIDRLPSSEQLTLKVASVIGRVFAYGVLRNLHPIESDQPFLREHLDDLERLDLTPLKDPEPDLSYIFKHVITQEVAYNLMLFSQRQELHRKAAELLENQSGENLARIHSLLAHHWSKSVEVPPASEADLQKALYYLEKAGEQAAQSYANQEAMLFYSRALELLQRLPASPERDRQELRLQTAIGPVWMNVKGYASDQVEQSFARARQLCADLGESSELFWVVWGLFGFSQLRARHQNAMRYGAELMRLAEQQDDPALLLEAHFAVGLTSFYLARFAASREHFEKAIALYDPESCREAAVRTGQNAGVTSLASIFLPLWHMGLPGEAMARSEQAVKLALEIEHPFSICYAYYFSTWMHLARRDADAAQAALDIGTPIARENNFPIWLTMGQILQGSIETLRGRGEEGCRLISQGLAMWQSTGAQLVMPFYLAFLAEAHALAGRRGEAMKILDDGLELMQRTEERFLEPEFYRLKGEILLPANPGEAERSFAEAIELAARQGGLSLKLRAALSLARLYQAQNRAAEALETIRQIQEEMTDRSPTPDLLSIGDLLRSLRT